MTTRRAQTATVLLVVSLVLLPTVGAAEHLLVQGGFDRAATLPAEDRASNLQEAMRSAEREREIRDAVRSEVAATNATNGTVRVGVVGSGFAAGSAPIADRVAAHRRFGERRAFETPAHDIAVAEIVTETAPNAELYLVGVGSTPTPKRYASAVEWLVAHDVDVVVDSGSYFPNVAGDGERVTAAAARASERGVVFVTSAGNYANRHWRGVGTRDGWVTFAPGVEANHLDGGDRTYGRVSLRLRWNTSADYDLYLYRQLPGDDAVVAKSTRRDDGPGRAVEAVDVAVPPGRYYVAVYAHDGRADPGRVQLFAAHHSLEYATPRGSMVAPATTEQVITVGAVRPNGTVAGYSSRGASGRTDVVATGSFDTRAAGSFEGTSAAAPYVAGTAALMESQNGSLSPDEVERILRDTSDESGVNPTAAVAAAENETRPTADRPQNETRPTRNDSQSTPASPASDRPADPEQPDDGQQPPDDDEERRDDGSDRRADPQRRDGDRQTGQSAPSESTARETPGHGQSSAPRRPTPQRPASISVRDAVSVGTAAV